MKFGAVLFEILGKTPLQSEASNGWGAGLTQILTNADAIKRYLTHVVLDPLPPARAPPSSLQESFDFMQGEFDS